MQLHYLCIFFAARLFFKQAGGSSVVSGNPSKKPKKYKGNEWSPGISIEKTVTLSEPFSEECANNKTWFASMSTWRAVSDISVTTAGFLIDQTPERQLSNSAREDTDHTFKDRLGRRGKENPPSLKLLSPTLTVPWEPHISAFILPKPLTAHQYCHCL